MNVDDLRATAQHHFLDLLGVVDLHDRDPLPEAFDQIVLLGPLEPGFWGHLAAQPEWAGASPDPIDEWSRRTITAIANKFGGCAVFPFGRPPYAPFIDWALRSGHFWPSPVSFLIHDRAGLMVSFRGAIAFSGHSLPRTSGRNPCLSCTAKPCLTACPGLAVVGEKLDIAACHETLSLPAGQDCMDTGCKIRRTCPVSMTYERSPEQSAHHMKAFHP